MLPSAMPPSARFRRGTASDSLRRLMRRQGELLERSRHVAQQAAEVVREVAPVLERVPRRERRADRHTAVSMLAVAIALSAVGTVAYLWWRRRRDAAHRSSTVQAHEPGSAAVAPNAPLAATQAAEPAAQAAPAAPPLPGAVIVSTATAPEGRGGPATQARAHEAGRARGGVRAGLPAAVPSFARTRMRAALPSTPRRPPFER